MRWHVIPNYAGLTVEEIRAALAPLGVRERSFKETVAAVYYQVDPETGALVKGVGDLIVRKQTGVIEVWPFQGVSENDLRGLYGSAEQAFSRHPPSKRGGWFFRQRGHGRSYWHTQILLPISPDDQVAQMVQANINVTRAAELRALERSGDETLTPPAATGRAEAQS